MADGSYYDRKGGVATDGTPTFATKGDAIAEDEVAKAIEAAWGCELHRFGALAPLDWFATRHGRMVAVLELKSRSHAKGEYPTVYLNVRKWLALKLASVGLGVRSVFVVRWTDAIGWVPVDEIDASTHRIGGCSRRVKSHTDSEPVIEVSVAAFKPLTTNGN